MTITPIKTRINDERVARNTERAAKALNDLQGAATHDAQLAAAKALESAACQLRRALKQ